MTVCELHNQICSILKAGGCETPAFDAVCLLEDIGGIGRGHVPSAAAVHLPDERTDAVLSAAKRRAAGEPLQYILGTWDFLGMTLEVGEGVLIPRPETELLCELAAAELAATSGKRVLDLCAGTGCVGLGVASLYPAAEVTAVELSQTAFSYLQRNVARYPAYAVKPVVANVLTDIARFPDTVDAIVSNPPYIPTADLDGLQREVQYEPRLALDGAEDGYRFYRVIAEQWLSRLAPKGFVAVEVGFGQAQTVAELFCSQGFVHTDIRADFAGIDRVVLAKR